jgi:hypothetical protein
MFDKNILVAIRNAAKRFGIPKSDVIPSILHIYAALSNTQNTVKFFIDDTTTVLKNNEQTLNKNNVHFTTSLGLAIHQVVGSKPANTPLDFYPDITKYAGATGQEAKDLEQVYGAKLSFKTDSNVRLENFKTNVFRSVPQTQKATAAHPSHGELALVETGSVFPIVGGQNNSAWIDLDAASAYAGIAGVNGTSANYAVLLCAGFEVRGASKNQGFIEFLEALSNGDV